LRVRNVLYAHPPTLEDSWRYSNVYHIHPCEAQRAVESTKYRAWHFSLCPYLIVDNLVSITGAIKNGTAYPGTVRLSKKTSNSEKQKKLRKKIEEKRYWERRRLKKKEKGLKENHHHIPVILKSLELSPTAIVNSPSGITQFCFPTSQ